MKPTQISGRRFGEERALYNRRKLYVVDCSFEGDEDGESALKEGRKIAVEKSRFILRYPMWHVSGLWVNECTFSENCRAPMWYDSNVKVFGSTVCGMKAMRECEGVTIEDSSISSPEFAWKCRDVGLKNSTVESDYAFFESRGIDCEGMKLDGKYALQYVRNVTLDGCFLNAKDALWHSRNVVVRDCEIYGEYLGWYSSGLTFVNCKISGRQPLCYCRNVRLIDCTMSGCSMSFEYSDVKAEIKGELQSVRNVRSGCVVADGYGEILSTDDSVYKSRAKILVRGRDEAKDAG